MICILELKLRTIFKIFFAVMAEIFIFMVHLLMLPTRFREKKLIVSLPCYMATHSRAIPLYSVLTPADEENHINKHAFQVPFVCGARDLGEALRRISEGAAMIRTKGEAGTGIAACFS